MGATLAVALRVVICSRFTHAGYVNRVAWTTGQRTLPPSAAAFEVGHNTATPASSWEYTCQAALMPLFVARTDPVDELSATGSGQVQAWRIARGEIDPDIEVDMTVKALGATYGQTDARTLMAAPLAQRSSVKTRWGLHTIDRPLASPMR